MLLTVCPRSPSIPLIYHIRPLPETHHMCVQVAPIAVYTSGKGSSAAGLTAAVQRDPVSVSLSISCLPLQYPLSHDSVLCLIRQACLTN